MRPSSKRRSPQASASLAIPVRTATVAPRSSIEHGPPLPTDSASVITRPLLGNACPLDRLGPQPQPRPDQSRTSRRALRVRRQSRVDCSLGAGEVIGARSVVPLDGMVEPNPEDDDDDVALVFPYHPGRDQLWPVSELGDALPRAHWIEHPLAEGADSLYVFSLGDSLRIKLPDGSAVQLREIRVRARRPESRLIVGSLWVDVARGSLVRAAYRPSVPIDLWPLMEREIGRNDRSTVQSSVRSRNCSRDHRRAWAVRRTLWLPRTRIASAEGTARARVCRSRSSRRSSISA